MVQQYLNELSKREKCFKDNINAMDWFKLFLTRHFGFNVKLVENTKRVHISVI